MRPPKTLPGPHLQRLPRSPIFDTPYGRPFGRVRRRFATRQGPRTISSDCYIRSYTTDESKAPELLGKSQIIRKKRAALRLVQKLANVTVAHLKESHSPASGGGAKPRRTVCSVIVRGM